MKQAFKDFQFKQSSLLLIRQANVILDDLRAQGYVLTLRQLYYQMVARDIIQNKQTEYKRLGSVINDARLAGLIDWAAIEDRTRHLKNVPHWETPGDIINSAANSFRLDKWATQKYRIEVWVEKDALVGVVERACRELDVSWFSCRGYTSQTALYDAGKRLYGHICGRQKPVVIHLGDHDPSGLDMTRDIDDRLFMFVGNPVEIRRVALNMNQIEELNPPPNPAKITDSRFEKYAEEHGDESWELDALDPSYINNLIETNVAEFRDDDKFEALRQEEEEKRRLLRQAATQWEDVESFLSDMRRVEDLNEGENKDEQ